MSNMYLYILFYFRTSICIVYTYNIMIYDNDTIRIYTTTILIQTYENSFQLNVLREQVFVSTSIILQILVYMKIQEYQHKLRACFVRTTKSKMFRAQETSAGLRASTYSEQSQQWSSSAAPSGCQRSSLSFCSRNQRRHEGPRMRPGMRPVHQNTARSPAARTCTADRSRTRSATAASAARAVPPASEQSCAHANANSISPLPHCDWPLHWHPRLETLSSLNNDAEQSSY